MNHLSFRLPSFFQGPPAYSIWVVLPFSSHQNSTAPLKKTPKGPQFCRTTHSVFTTWALGWRVRVPKLQTAKPRRLGSNEGALRIRLGLLVGYHGEPKVNIFHNIRIIYGLYYRKRLKVTYSTTRLRSRNSDNPDEVSWRVKSTIGFTRVSLTCTPQNRR